MADASRLIPPYNDTTQDPADVYALHDIVPESEWKSIVTSPFDQAKSLKDKQALFPFRHSSWVNWHLKSLQGTSVKGVKKKMYAASILFDKHPDLVTQKTDILRVGDACVPSSYQSTRD